MPCVRMSYNDDVGNGFVVVSVADILLLIRGMVRSVKLSKVYGSCFFFHCINISALKCYPYVLACCYYQGGLKRFGILKPPDVVFTSGVFHFKINYCI
jgi:hypothetical protein